MANREAIRELQTRLASRLQAAQSQGVAASWLAVRAGAAGYVFPLAQSGEIFPLTPVQTVPYARPWFMGVVNLRGSLYGVVDLASFVGEGGALTREDPALAESCVITFSEVLGLNCALRVDRLAGLRRRDAFAEEKAPPEGSPVYFGSRFTDRDGAHWQEINLHSLSQWADFLDISA